MIVRTLAECEQTDRKVHSKTGTWDSTRLLLKDDNMGFSFHITTIYAGTETHIHYQNHLESVYCMSGNGTHMMNGIGGSGDFARNARISIFVTTSTAKDGKISSIVPFVTHVDHTNHDVDVIITEQGYADLRGLAPVEAAARIINNCMHPDYRAQALAYLEEAKQRGGHTPHVLEKAFSWHANFAKNGTMLLDK